MKRLKKTGTAALAAALFFGYLSAILFQIPRLSVISPRYLEQTPLCPQQAAAFEAEARQKQKEGRIPVYYSHRGDSIDHVEHTWSSYDAAIRKGSGNIEQDLVLSKDGTLYVSHDENALRITGVNQEYRNMTDRQIQTLRTANGEQIHSLEDVFGRYGKTVHYIVEVRPVQEEVVKFIEIVKTCGMEENITVQCKDTALIRELRNAFPRMPVLYLAMDLNDVQLGLTDPDIDIVSVNRKWISSEMGEWIHSYRKLYSVWTLDTEEEIRRAQAAGVDIFFSDDTALAQRMTRRDTP